MTESEFETPTEEKFGVVQRLWSAWQWLIAVILALIVLVTVFATDQLSAPDAPQAGYWSAVAILAVVAVLLCPPAFFRLPKAGKWLAYLAILPAFLFVATMSNQVRSAYERTPEGAMVAAERNAANSEQAKAEAREAEAEKEKAETADLLAKAEAEGEKLKEIMEQQDDCLSWGGELKDLNRMVRDSLHNPDSFEHVSTEFIVPTADRHNVLLTFRAENGFGAKRAARVTASMIPENCEILEVGEPQPL